jgi:hypothetical protein
METNCFDKTADQLNRVTHVESICTAIIVGSSAILWVIGLSGLALYNEIEIPIPLDWLLFLFCSLVMIALILKPRMRVFSADDIKIQADMEAPEIQSDPYEGAQSSVGSWQVFTDRLMIRARQKSLKKISASASQLVAPVILCLAFAANATTVMGNSWQVVGNIINSFSAGARLHVVKGQLESQTSKVFELKSSRIAEVEVNEDNLIEIELTAANEFNFDPEVVLRYPKKSIKEGVYQSFRMLPQRRNGDLVRYSLKIVVQEPLDLYLSTISTTKPVATLKVKKLPVPEITIAFTTEPIEDPWPDDRPINISVKVAAENPLQTVSLLIKSGKRQSRELVLNIMAENRHAAETVYSLVLEPYIESDFASVEIMGEAVDRGLPRSLVGFSEPLTLNTVSAYGRYRLVLQKLRELKTSIDQSLSKQISLAEQANDIAENAAAQSDDSPFFDALDRIELERFRRSTAAIVSSFDGKDLVQLSSELNEFLLDHEAIDDRERDRDFFVALRGLSRVVEKSPKDRTIKASVLTDRVKEFLDDRRQRWALRIKRIPPELVPAQWRTIEQEKPFHRAMDRVKADAGQIKTIDRALGQLSSTTSDYRKWITELERVEDQSRRQKEQQRQQGLANARDRLKEIQKQQGKISQQLDRAAERDQQKLADEWPSIKMMEKSNINQTASLENQLRALSPQASERIKVALEAMEITVSSGNDKKFTQSESTADLAGRLLRQADSAARKAQRQKAGGRRRRRVSGDNYYGQSVVGGDIEIRREYQVDSRYREDVLNDVQSLLESGAVGGESAERQLLEDYLRNVIR